MTQVNREHVRIARVVGENEEGLTLFVPKDMQGEFHLEGGEKFLTLVFVHSTEDGMQAWLPWEGQ
jgi:hypothetical protein